MNSVGKWAVLVCFAFMLSIVIAAGSASASVVTDIPEAINEALFDGVSLWAAKALLTACVMVSVGLALAVLRMPPAGMFLILLSVLGGLTAIGWADITFLVLAILVAVAMFGKTMVQWMQGQESEN